MGNQTPKQSNRSPILHILGLLLAILGFIFIAIVAFGVWGPSSYFAVATEISQFVQEQPARRYDTYAGNLLTLLIIILSLTGILVTAFAAALTLGLRAYFSSKADAFYEQTLNEVKERIDKLTDRTTRTLEETESELYNFDKVRLYESTASSAVQFSIQEWEITKDTSANHPDNEYLLREEFKSLLRSFKLNRFAEENLRNAEKELRSIQSDGREKLNAAKKRAERVIFNFKIIVYNNLTFFLSNLKEPRFSDIWEEAQKDGKLPAGHVIKDEIISFLGQLKNANSHPLMEGDDLKRVFRNDSVIYAKWRFALVDPEDLAVEAQALVYEAMRYGSDELAQRYRTKYAAVLRHASEGEQ